VSLGVRCACIQLFAIKKRATQPQALLLLCMYLSLLVSAMQWQIASLAPQVQFLMGSFLKLNFFVVGGGSVTVNAVHFVWGSEI
jgi:hypothetical protein